MSPGRKGSRSARPGILGAVRLAVAVLAVSGLAAVGVHLGTQETPDIDTLRDPSTVWTGGRVRVEVYNGGGVTGMARAATSLLRDARFDVVTFGNAEAFDPARPSVVVDRVGRADMARAVAAALGIDNVQSDPDPNLFVDVTVVLGRDWAGPDGAATVGSSDDEGAWWDPRSWFED